jgi:hypothetical protein
MTSYMLFAGLGLLIYAGVAFVEAAMTRFDEAAIAAAGDQSLISANRSPSAVVVSESQAAANREETV